ncbi:hypothetical protein ABMA28_012093 [Loxostege sticticalis]|uniref:Uncharacterized protein n=1 Tax=Loxostege sticticalis TaxID=481309 RepID=A0ABD0TLL1_LOXSC
MATAQIVLVIEVMYFFEIFASGNSSGNVSTIPCPYLRNSPPLNVQDLVGSWLTVYTQPKAIDCFTLHIRATTDLEREQYVIKYGNFSGRVAWDTCFLEVESPLGKHFLQGNGSEAGVLENVIVSRGENGKYIVHDQSADQWTVYGRRGSEVLVMRDCMGEAAAAFARAPYWPSADELYAILHRSGIAPLAHGRVLCEPRDLPSNQLTISRYISYRN